jgi:hypothetical protein
MKRSKNAENFFQKMLQKQLVEQFQLGADRQNNTLPYASRGLHTPHPSGNSVVPLGGCLVPTGHLPGPGHFGKSDSAFFVT